MELLAPAGDLKILKSAFASGADAVYFGGDAFGARVSAAFSREDGAAAIEYAHLRGKKVYLTVNTLLKNPEMERELYDFLSFYDSHFIDGIIVQDFGVFDFCRYHFPNLPLHASTQMNISSEYGARFMMERGASRIVPARELSIAEIASIHEALPDLEIEAFLHGALCVCYSGQCLMSSVIGGRSGNRGACAQPCRKKYVALDENGQVIGEEGFYLSPRDLCGLYALPRLYEAKVESYKIEGRLKNEAYVAGVVSVYREYFDRIISDGTKDYRVDDRDYKRLLSYGTRGGSTDAYFDMRNDVSMIDPASGAFRQENSRVDICEKKRSVSSVINIEVGEPISMNLTYGTLTVSVEGEVAEAAQKKATTKDEIIDKITKTGEEAFDFSEVTINMEGDAFIPMKHIKELRRRAFDTLSKMLLKEYFHRERRPYEKPDVSSVIKNVIGNEIQNANAKEDHTPALFVSVSTKEQLAIVLKSAFVSGVIVGEELISAACDSTADVYFRLPDVIRRDDTSRMKGLLDRYCDRISGVVANSYDALGFLESYGYSHKDVYFGERLYSYSDRTVAAFAREGYINQHVPIELNEKELSHRYNEKSTMDIYGRTAVMIMANCPAKRFYGCLRDDTKQDTPKAGEKPYTRIDLVDETGAAFPVLNRCASCTNYVYNSLPQSLLSDFKRVMALHPGQLLISFVFESADEVNGVLEVYKNNYMDGGAAKLDIPSTRLHFKRGVS